MRLAIVSSALAILCVACSFSGADYAVRTNP